MINSLCTRLYLSSSPHTTRAMHCSQYQYWEEQALQIWFLSIFRNLGLLFSPTRGIVVAALETLICNGGSSSRRERPFGIRRAKRYLRRSARWAITAWPLSRKGRLSKATGREIQTRFGAPLRNSRVGGQIRSCRIFEWRSTGRREARIPSSLFCCFLLDAAL